MYNYPSVNIYISECMCMYIHISDTHPYPSMHPSIHQSIHPYIISANDPFQPGIHSASHRNYSLFHPSIQPSRHPPIYPSKQPYRSVQHEQRVAIYLKCVILLHSCLSSPSESSCLDDVHITCRQTPEIIFSYVFFLTS